jgi:hypothetical protein
MLDNDGRDEKFRNGTGGMENFWDGTDGTKNFVTGRTGRGIPERNVWDEIFSGRDGWDEKGKISVRMLTKSIL